MTGRNIAPPDPEKGYYLYAFVHRTQTTGTFDLTETTYEMEDDRFPNHYCLMVGILNSEYEGTRSYVDMYGFTEIAPGRITTDRIVSSNGLNYVDLLHGAIRSGIFDSSNNMTSGLETNPQSKDRTVVIKGAVVQSQSGDESRLPCKRGEYNSSYIYYEGDEVTYTVNGGTSSYRCINTDPKGISNDPPTNTSSWQVFSSQGSNGEDGKDGDYYEYRYAVNGSTVDPPALNATSASPSGWSTEQPSVGVLQYLWRTFAKKSSDGKLLSGSWSTPVRVTPYDGIDGKDGKDGETGPSLNFRGVYSPDEKYNGNSKVVDAVKYTSNGETLYYVARTDAGNGFNALPTDTDYWNSFGAQFESIATGLLLAELAYIKNLGVENLKTSTGAQRIEICEATNSLIFYYNDKEAVSIVSYQNAEGKTVPVISLKGEEHESAMYIERNKIQFVSGSDGSPIQISEIGYDEEKRCISIKGRLPTTITGLDTGDWYASDRFVKIL